MGKAEFLSPKWISNRSKASGLQKLRWYCQMCNKQCRDENGFKCHCMSDSHQRQMIIFGQNPTGIVHHYSQDFESSFLDHMKRSHRSSRVAATVVYNEYIADRHHVHMNSTQWATLTEFVKYLGRSGKCKVDETPKGWFITYIDRNSENVKNKRIKADMVEEEKHENDIQRQIERAEQMRVYEKPKEVQVAEARPFGKIIDGNIQSKVKLSLGLSKISREASRLMFEEEEYVVVKSRKRKQDSSSVLGALMEEDEKAKERMNRKDYWLFEGIVVKVMNQALAHEGYYKQKGMVRKVIDKYCGEIKMLGNKHVLRVDQEELETVLPQIGGLVKIVNGAYRGELARLLSIDADNFSATVQIEKGIYDGRILKAVNYEDICKVLHI